MLFGRGGSNAIAAGGLLSNRRTRVTSFALEVNTRRLDKLGPEVRIKVVEAVQKATADVQAHTVKNIRDKNLIKTGNLLNSVQGSSSLDNPLTGYVDVGAYYGIYHEFGTRHMAARPFLGPAVNTVAPSFIKAVRQAVREATEK